MDSVPTEHPVDHQFPLQTVEAHGRRFSYRESGHGPAIVLLHGIGSGSGSWLSQLDGLSGEHRIIAWDAPGYGATTPVESPSPKATEYAAALENLLAALNAEPAVLIGHSFGALTAGSYASTHGDLPMLILADPANGYGAVDERPVPANATQGSMQCGNLALMALRPSDLQHCCPTMQLDEARDLVGGI